MGSQGSITPSDLGRNSGSTQSINLFVCPPRFVDLPTALKRVLVWLRLLWYGYLKKLVAEKTRLWERIQSTFWLWLIMSYTLLRLHENKIGNKNKYCYIANNDISDNQCSSPLHSGWIWIRWVSKSISFFSNKMQICWINNSDSANRFILFMLTFS